MRLRHSTFLTFLLTLVTLPLWLAGASVVLDAGRPSSNDILTAHSHFSLESPNVHSVPLLPGKTFWVSGKSETIDLEEDGHLAVWMNIGLDLEPVDLPAQPFLLDAIAPERNTSLFLSLGRFRC